MIRLEFIKFVSLGFVLGAWVFIIGNWWANEYEESVHAVNDCVNERWVEYENRVDQMPTIELEKTWWLDCAEKNSG